MNYLFGFIWGQVKQMARTDNNKLLTQEKVGKQKNAQHI